MINMFGSNHSEVGSLSENLILNTAGKIKIRFGQKFIDLLDNKGNINVSVPNVITEVSSKDKMTSDGFYLMESNLYVCVGNKITQITGDGAFVSFDENQIVTEDQIKNAQNNIGLSYDSEEEALKEISNGIVIVDNELKAIKNGKISNYLNNVLKEINNSEITEISPIYSNYKEIPRALVKQGNEWKYVSIVPWEEESSSITLCSVTWTYTENDETKQIITTVYYNTSAVMPDVLIAKGYTSNYDYSPITKNTVINCNK